MTPERSDRTRIGDWFRADRTAEQPPGTQPRLSGPLDPILIEVANMEVTT
ncbi:MAG: hypothetical protein QM655_12545 [Nocardioidaceae bacterium]